MQPHEPPVPTIVETPEKKQTPFESAAHEVYASGRQKMKEAGEKEGRVFHTIDHPESLIERAKKLSAVFDLSKEQKKMVALEAMYHDLVINYDPPQNPDDVTGRIKRHRGAREGDQPAGENGNEALSAQALVDAMREQNEQAKKNGESPVFSEQHMADARFAIDTTYPGVQLGQDFRGTAFREYPLFGEITSRNARVGEIIDSLEKNGVTKGALFFQPHLETPLEQGKRVGEDALVIALSDLGSAGFDPPEKFFREGDTEFLELMENARRPEVQTRLLEGTTQIDQENRAKVAASMIQWLKDQTSFVAWQMLRFEKIVCLLRKNGQIDEKKEGQLRSLFNHFEKNIEATAQRAKNAEQQYEELKKRNGELEAFRFLTKEIHV